MSTDCLRIFERTEKKYVLTGKERAALWRRIGGRLKPDKHPHETVCSLYFDTDDRRVIRTSIEKPVYKEKVRLRSYGVPKENDTVFLEIKKKYKGVVYKRRETLTLREARDYLNGGAMPRESQILREIDWTIHVRQKLSPAAYIAYQREAFNGAEYASLRITFDDHILYRDTDLALESGIYGESILDNGLYIMEIKAPGAMPIWLADALDECKIYPASFSKYGKAYETTLRREAFAC